MNYQGPKVSLLNLLSIIHHSRYRERDQLRKGLIKKYKKGLTEGAYNRNKKAVSKRTVLIELGFHLLLRN